MGSPENSTDVTPAALNFAIADEACSCKVAGSRAKDTDSVTSTPYPASCSSKSASLVVDASPLSIQSRPKTRD